VSCYEQFGWSPDDVRALPGKEAELLSVYFEELSAHQAKQIRKHKNNSGSGSSGNRSDEITEFELKDDDWEDDDYSEWLRLEQQED
jgi:hypothetical protein